MSPLVHVHEPATQVAPDVHRCAQAPQLLASVCSSTHVCDRIPVIGLVVTQIA